MAKTRRNKSEGGKRRNKTEGGNRKDKRNKSEGGRRKTRKMSPGATSWQKSVMKVYHDLKAKNPETKLRDAMKKASEMKRKGLL